MFFNHVPRYSSLLFALGLAALFLLLAAGSNTASTAEHDPTVYLPYVGSAPSPPAVPGHEPAPSDYADLIRSNVRDGVWTLEEGLVAVLQHLAGERAADEVSGVDDVIYPLATGVLLMAEEYVANGEDPDAQAEIGRLLDVLAPSLENVEAYAEPAPAGNGPERPEAATEEDCGGAWRDDFPLPNVDGVVCFFYDVIAVEGDTYSFYYQPSYHENEERAPYLAETMTAVERAVTYYSQFGAMEGATIILSDYVWTPTALGATPWLVPADDEPCPVLMFPTIFEYDVADYGFVVAHELFHCFQKENMPGVPFERNQWWFEGSASYFANAVYTDATLHHQPKLIDNLRLQSRNAPPMEMDYENWVFFQYLADELGDAELVDLLKRLASACCIENHAETMSTLPDMNQLFQDYAKAFVQGDIVDAGGKRVVTEHPLYLSDDPAVIDTTTNEEKHVDDFVIWRSMLQFQSDNFFHLTETADEPLRHTADNRGSSEYNWQPLPSVAATCTGEKSYLLLLTTTEPNQTLDYELSVPEAFEDICDCYGVVLITGDRTASFAGSAVHHMAHDFYAGFSIASPDYWGTLGFDSRGWRDGLIGTYDVPLASVRVGPPPPEPALIAADKNWGGTTASVQISASDDHTTSGTFTARLANLYLSPEDSYWVDVFAEFTSINGEDYPEEAAACRERWEATEE